MAEKNILALSIISYIPMKDETVFLEVFLDLTRVQLLLFYITMVVGNDAIEKCRTLSTEEFVEFIFLAKNDYTIDSELITKITDQFALELDAKSIEGIISKYKDNDSGSLNFAWKRIIDHLLQLDESKVEIKHNLISHGALEVFNAIERKESHTIAQNSEIAGKYVGNDKALIKKVVEQNNQDTVIAAFNILKEGKIVSCGSILYNLLTHTLLQSTFIYSKSIPFDECTVNNNLVDVYHAVQKLAEDESDIKEISAKMQDGFKKISNERLGVALQSLEPAKVEVLFKRCFPAEVTSGSYEILIQKFNSIILDCAFAPQFTSTNDKKANNYEPDPSAAKKKRAEVEVDLVLSPTKGVKVSQLQAGSRIYVIINATTSLGRKVVNQLNLMEENRVKPVSAVVEEVVKSEDGYTVLTRIASNLNGRALEEEDIKVKSGDPVVDKKIDKSRKSLVTGLVIGLIILSLIGFSIWVLL